MASPAPDASAVVPDYESMLILGRSDNSIFDAHDPPEPIATFDGGLDAHPTSTMSAQDRTSRSPQRLQGTARASSPPANAGMMGGLPSNISLSWTDILRPLDQTPHQLVDQITAPPGLMTTLSATDMEGGNATPAQAPAFVQQQHSTASPAGVRPPSPPPLRAATEQQQQQQQQQHSADLNLSSNRAGRGKESTSTTTTTNSARPTSPTRAGSPGPQPVVLGALKGKIVASKVDTWRAPSPKRERKNGGIGSASPPGSLGSAEVMAPQHMHLPASPPRRVQTADADQLAIAVASPASARSLSSPPVPAASVFSGNQGSNVQLLQQSSFSAALQDMARQNAPSAPVQSFEVTSPSKALSKLQQDQLQILLREAEANMQHQQQGTSDRVKEVLPKVDTWRDERMSPTARRRAQMQQEQRQLDHQRMLEAQAIERDRIWRAEQVAEQERRRRDQENSIGIQACSLDFLVSVGAEPKAAPVPQPQPMSPSAVRRAAAAGGVQPKVDTWWREGVPRSRSPSFQEKATNSPTRTESVPQQYVQQHQHAHQQNQYPIATSPTRQGSPPGGRKTWAQTRTEPSPPPVRAQITPASPSASMAAAGRPRSPTRTSQDNVPRAASPPVRPSSPSARSRMAQQAAANQVTPLHVAVGTPASPIKDVPWENSLRFPPPSPTRGRKTSAAQMDSAVVATPRSPAAASQMRVVTPSSPTRQQQMQKQVPQQQVQQQQQQLMVDTSMGGAGSQLSASSPAGSPTRSRKLYADVQAVVSSTRSRSGTGLSAAPVDEDGESLPKRAAIDSVFFSADGKANLVVRAKSVWSYLASDGVYVAVLLVFLVLVADLMTGSMAARHNTGCVQVARQLTNVGEVMCDGQY